MPKLWQQYLKTVTGRERKSALLLLSEIVKDGNEALCDDALELANEYGKLDNDNIRQCYLLISKPEKYPQPLALSTQPPPLNYRPDLGAYDALTGFPKRPNGVDVLGERSNTETSELFGRSLSENEQSEVVGTMIGGVAL